MNRNIDKQMDREREGGGGERERERGRHTIGHTDIHTDRQAI